jgi:hypothetical protein
MRQKPPSILVVAILNLVLGGFGLLCSVCSGLGPVFSVSLTSMLSPKSAQLTAGMGINDVPGYLADQYMDAAIGLVTAALLLVSGIGLLRMQCWARRIALAYVLVRAATEVGILCFHLFYLNSAIALAVKEAIERQAAIENNPAFAANPVMSLITSIAYYHVMSIVRTVAFLVYPTILLVILSRRSVVTALCAE